MRTRTAAALCGLFFAANGWAKIGLNVDPGQALIRDVKPGVKCTLKERAGVDFVIRNSGEAEGTYALSVKKPSDAGMKPFQGYRDIPDTAWVWFEEKGGGAKVSEVKVPANGEKKLELCLEVPKGREYFNRHWEVAVLVEGGSGGTFSLAVTPKYQIETASAAGYAKGESPAGEYLEPSAVEVSGVTPDRDYAAAVTFHNNTAAARTYTITALSPPGEVRSMFIPWTDGWERIPSATMIVPSCEGETPHPRTKNGKPITPLKEITLKAGESAKIALAVKVTKEDWKPAKKWEGFLFVTREGGETSFARVMVATEGRPGEGRP